MASEEKDKLILKAASEYEQNRHLYEKLINEVKYVLNERLRTANIRVDQILGRAKTVESFKEKAERKAYTNPLQDTTDLAGVRVVCYYESDMSMLGDIIQEEFDVQGSKDKTEDLGVDKMGYNGSTYLIVLGPLYSGARYDNITQLKCEIQLRTVLQDAWALISHHLVYKNESSVPGRIKRDLNNVASLLEIAQGVFDSIREKRDYYLSEIHNKESDKSAFLELPIDYDTLKAYTEWKFPNLGVSDRFHSRLLADIDTNNYRNLKEIDQVIEQAKPAVDAYKKEDPRWFRNGTAYITKSLGFVDTEFRNRHPFGQPTRDAFKKFENLIKQREES